MSWSALSRLSILRFAVIGALGMPVDAGVLWLMTHKAGLDPYSGRIISWLCAATFTWTGNRYFTFGAKRARGLTAIFREWLRFLAANAVGGLVNVGLYSTLVRFAPPPVDTGLRAVESQFQLLVCCHCGHNFEFNYASTMTSEVGQRLSNLNFLKN